MLGQAVGVDDRAAAAERDDHLADAKRAQGALRQLEAERVELVPRQLEDADMP